MSSILIEQIIPAVSHILQIFPDGVPEMGRAEYRGRKMEQWSLAMNVPLEVHHSGIRDYFMQQIGMDEFVRRILTFWAAHTAPCNRTIEHLRAALDSTVSMTSNESWILAEMTRLMPQPVYIDVHSVSTPTAPVSYDPPPPKPPAPATQAEIDYDDVASGWSVANLNIATKSASGGASSISTGPLCGAKSDLRDDSDYTISRRGTEEHLKNKSADWAAAIAGSSTDKWSATNVKNLKGDWSNATWD